MERIHILKDAGEEYERRKAAATSPEERDTLMREFAEFRTRHREEDIRRGKRLPGFHLQTQQIMWARWIEIAASHERDAMKALDAARAGEPQLAEELRQSLVAITAAACAVEALYEDVKYLIDDRRRIDDAAERITDCLSEAFGLPRTEHDQLLDNLTWLFERRNEGLHPYSEMAPTEVHPAGLNTSAEMAHFNGQESRKALVVALGALELAANPPSPANRRVERWIDDRRTYHEQVVDPIRSTITGH
ncbi:hypothetical protein Daura_50155 [Dactylosporangium aurantiacum]|uniref:Uncharacterized protein n=1 Tax=Dactylosporangium aurantiacum TaxID=35754 RepID=A0A9Q9IDV5_9ACTN|nr:hypothetical protein [Dactylosporangium aurantiacum]MDG6107360.1 hypothetical protein [Dactylosporangium aurantiacum]UWZ54509.1 hypothetical protein Daura_50155 [Dactylosporangium aurantiacum]